MMSLLLLIGGLGLGAGFLSGLLGIGGGIVMAPLLLYVPPLFGFEPLPMRVVAGLTMVQGLIACVAGGIVHRRFNFVCRELSLYMGGSIFVASLVGGAAARFVPNQALLLTGPGRVGYFLVKLRPMTVSGKERLEDFLANGRCSCCSRHSLSALRAAVPRLWCG
ncbi:MAG: TSUP family transporter [Desulfobulbaceae bacterium]